MSGQVGMLSPAVVLNEVKLLLRKGANPVLVVNTHKTPAESAEKFRDTDVIEVVKRASAKRAVAMGRAARLRNASIAAPVPSALLLEREASAAEDALLAELEAEEEAAVALRKAKKESKEKKKSEKNKG